MINIITNSIIVFALIIWRKIMFLVSKNLYLPTNQTNIKIVSEKNYLQAMDNFVNEVGIK